MAPMSHYLKLVTPFKLSNKIFLWVEAKRGNSEPRRPTFILPQELSSCTWGFWWKVSGHGHEFAAQMCGYAVPSLHLGLLSRGSHEAGALHTQMLITPDEICFPFWCTVSCAWIFLLRVT